LAFNDYLRFQEVYPGKAQYSSLGKLYMNISCGIYRWFEMLSFKWRPTETAKAQRLKVSKVRSQRSASSKTNIKTELKQG
jgi:hypothetical protein